MPQYNLFATVHPVEWQFTYRTDPTRPDVDPVVSCAIRDHAGATLAWQACHVPAALLVPAMDDVLGASWRDYLFSTPKQAMTDLRTKSAFWRSRARALANSD